MVSYHYSLKGRRLCRVTVLNGSNDRLKELSVTLLNRANSSTRSQKTPACSFLIWSFGLHAWGAWDGTKRNCTLRQFWREHRFYWLSQEACKVAITCVSGWCAKLCSCYLLGFPQKQKYKSECTFPLDETRGLSKESAVLQEGLNGVVAFTVIG